MIRAHWKSYINSSNLIIVGDFNLSGFDWTTNQATKYSEHNIIVLEIGKPFFDHNLIRLSLNARSYENRVSKKEVYALYKTDWNYLKMLFAISPWELALADENINRNWENWKDLYFEAVDECVPKYRQKRKSNASWITKELIKLSRKKRNSKG